jgi:hypothetical protein
MTTDLKTDRRIVVYDGDCPMCTSTINTLLGLRLLKPQQTRSNHELDPTDFETVAAAGIHNQLVVFDPRTRETRAGVDGLLWMMQENTGNQILVRLVALPGPRHLLKWGYQAISYNRRIISPPRHRIVCDCEPEVILGRRLSLIVPVLVLTMLLVGGFGAAVYVGWQLGDAREGALLGVIAVAASCMVLALASLILEEGKRIDYLGHAVITLLVGGLILVPASLAAPFVPRGAAMAVVYLSVVLSLALMLAMQRRRIAALAIPNWWSWIWLAVMSLAIAATTYAAVGRWN